MVAKTTARYERFVQELQECRHDSDIECAHIVADGVLYGLVEELCLAKYGSIPRVIKRALKTYREVPKWYA